MPGILALDQSVSAIGWAHAELGEEPQSGHQRLGREGASPPQIAEALSIFMDARIELFRPELIVRERFYYPRIGTAEKSTVPFNAHTVYILGGLAWQIDEIAQLAGIPCIDYATSAVTAWFTGQGRYKTADAKKRAVVRACRDRGWRILDHNEADARALLLYAEKTHYPSAAVRRPAGPLFGARP